VVWILLVTWLTNNQPPHSYQTEFVSKEACELARKGLVAEQANLQIAEDRRHQAEIKQRGELVATSRPVPQLTAVCAPNG